MPFSVSDTLHGIDSKFSLGVLKRWVGACCSNEQAGNLLVLGFALLASGSLALAPVAYSTYYVNDSLFTLNAGYLVYNGKIPNIDFTYFYGGFDAAVVALCFKLFGVTAKALDYSIVFVYATVLLLFYTALWRRLSPVSFFLSFLLITTIIFCRAPFEEPMQFSEQSYAMFYNRIGWAISFIIVLYPFGSRRKRPSTLASNLAIAISACILLLTKAPFVVFIVFAILFMVLKGRWADVLTVLLMLGIIILVISFSVNGGGNLFYRPFVELWLKSQENQSSRFTFMHKFELIFMYNLLSIAYVIVPAIFVFVSSGEEGPVKDRVVNACALIVLIGLALFVGVSNGALPMEYVTIPLLSAGAIITIEHAQSFNARNSSQMRLAIVMLALFSLGFCGPYLLNSAGGTVKAWTRTDRAMFAAGPLRNLVVQGHVAQRDAYPRREEAIDYILRRDALEGGINWLNTEAYLRQFILIDGIELAKTVEGVEHKKIISFESSVFPFALRSEPITSFPLWPVRTQIYDQNSADIPPDIDVVMVNRDDVTNWAYLHFKASIQKDFVLARESKFWALYARRESEPAN